MNKVKELNCWAVFDARSQSYVGVGGNPAIADDQSTLMSCGTAGFYLSLMHDQGQHPWPSPFSLALSLDVANLVSLVLLNCWHDDKEEIEEGASVIVRACASYVEKTWRGLDGVSLRILVRGTIPDGARIPPRVQIQRSGFVCLTMMRIPALPTWLREDDGGIIKNCSSVLDDLFVPKRPEYIRA